MPLDTERGGEDTPSQKLILVVEDDDAHGQMLLLVIEQETPYRGLLVSHGIQALEILPQVKPDLVLLDYQLPHLNGLEVCARIRALPEFGTMPIVLVTGSVYKLEFQVAGLPLLAKPYEVDSLLEILHHHLDR
jgi:CheY-like chemotaxis protein